VSDKVLVKQLQKEVARLEAELKIPEGNENCSSDALLHAKDLQIQKVSFMPMLVLFILST
jgi:centromeric protein E